MEIKSKLLKQKLTFSQPGETYIFVDMNGQPGSLGRQLFKDGGAVTYSGDSDRVFAKMCRRWYREHMKDGKPVRPESIFDQLIRQGYSEEQIEQMRQPPESRPIPCTPTVIHEG